MLLNNLEIGDIKTGVINAFIEIPKGGRNKYEYDEQLEALRLDRILSSPIFYPTDYGFIPQTLADDGDHLDVLIVTESPACPGCVVKVRVIGALKMTDENGLDYKILAVVENDPIMAKKFDVADLNEHLLKEINHFFDDYKTLEDNKFSNVEGWKNREFALQEIERCALAYKNKNN
ncbi:MAG: inorganic diphosphatase [Candidatus Parcubacteria bacterium]|nr:inorganic diphosphatase [Candidatus Parcubacteria bacterium]